MNPAAIPATIGVIALLGFFAYVLVVEPIVSHVRKRRR